MYLIFDVSAAGPVRNWKAPVDDTFSWPRMTHASWILLDENFKPIKDYNCIIKPKGFNLSEDMAKKSSIDREKAITEGDNVEEVLEHFENTMKEAKYIFSHNLNFNASVIGAEFLRAGKRNRLPYSDTYCLMHEATYYCKLKGKGAGYKWPTLRELHSVCFHQSYTPVNNARADVIAAARCFIKLMKTGALEDCFDDE